MREKPAIQAVGLSMAFSGVPVLQKVDFDLHPGEVVAITGENGAGKSTLAKLLAGIHRPTEGEIRVAGEAVRFGSLQDAVRHGVSLVHQEPQSFPDLSVAENLFIGCQPTTNGLVDWAAMNTRAAAALAKLDPKLDPKRLVAGLTVADRQLIEVAGALERNANVLLFDETTASLTPKEAQDLFQIIRRLKDEGKAIAFVSHRMEEVFALADRIVVLRDGAKVFDGAAASTTRDAVVRLMVGREVPESLKEGETSGQVALEVRSLSVRGRVRDVSFTVHAGEIVALAGLVGSGRTDVAHALFGAAPFGGSVTVVGDPYAPRSPADALERGVVLVPEDRQKHGLLLPNSIGENVTLPILRRLSDVWTSSKRDRSIGRAWIERLGIACQSVLQPVAQLSGGNQQKVVLAKSLEAKPRLLIVDEPTRGVDVGAKSEVHALLRRLAGEGMAILMISSDLPEVLAMADRVLVMREGSLVAKLGSKEATADRVMLAATGQEAATG